MRAPTGAREAVVNGEAAFDVLQVQRGLGFTGGLRGLMRLGYARQLAAAFAASESALFVFTATVSTLFHKHKRVIAD